MQAARLHYSTNGSTCSNYPTFQQTRSDIAATPLYSFDCCQSLCTARGQSCTIHRHLYHALSSPPASGLLLQPITTEAATYARMTFKLC